MAPPTFYVHIGQGKTGSTSLQAFLRLNRERLAREGFFYPDVPGVSENGNATPAALSLLDNTPAWVGQLAGASTPQHEWFDRLWLGLVHACGHARALILSSEEFEAVPAKVLRARSRDDGTVTKIVVYLRRQDRVIESLYGQLVRENYTTKSLTAFTNEILHGQSPAARAYAYHDFLSEWAEAFGRENLTVIAYRRQTDDYIYRAFVEALGLTFSTTYRLPEPQNETHAHRVPLSYLRLCNTLCRLGVMTAHSRLAHRQTLTTVASTVGLRGRRFRMRSSLRSRVMEAFAEQNRKAARDFVPTGPPDLFDPRELSDLASY